MVSKLNTIKWTRVGIALSIIGGFFGMVGLVFFFPIPSGIRDIIMMLVGALIGNLNNIVNYYFGNSLNKPKSSN